MSETRTAQQHGAISILLVEPFEEIRTLLEVALRNAGHEVRPAADGEAAVLALREESFDCVMVGSPVPVDAGGEPRLMLQWLQEHYGASERPCTIVLTTCVDSVAVLAFAARLRVCAVIAKPFTPAALLDVMSLCLKQRHAPTLWLGIPQPVVAQANAVASRLRSDDDLVR